MRVLQAYSDRAEGYREKTPGTMQQLHMEHWAVYFSWPNLSVQQKRGGENQKKGAGSCGN